MEFSRINDPRIKRSELLTVEPIYKKILDCLKGSDQIKKGRTNYLPMPNATDQSKENLARYEAYLTRAVYCNVVGETNEMFQGQLQLRPPKIELPEILEPMRENADGQGLSLAQLIKDGSSCVVPFSRGGWYTDFPALPDGKKSFTREDIANGVAMPTIRFIKPWNIYNWQEETIGNKKRVTLVVIREEVEYREPETLNIENRERFLVLHLEGRNSDEAVVYIVSEVPDNKEAIFQQKRFALKTADGKPMKRLPFSPVGSQNNDMSIDIPLLYTLTELNLAHYRSSADYFESAFQLGQPTPVLSGLSQSWAQKILDNKVQLGSTTFLPLPVGGKAELLQADPNTLAGEAMIKLEDQMIKVGAELTQARSTVERKEAEIDAEGSAKTSKLGKLASNIERSLKDALTVAHSFISRDPIPEFEIDINKVFNAGAKSTSQLREINELFQAADPVISKTEFRSQLRLAGIAQQNDTEALAEIESMIKERTERSKEMQKSIAESRATTVGNQTGSSDQG